MISLLDVNVFVTHEVPPIFDIFFLIY